MRERERERERGINELKWGENTIIISSNFLNKKMKRENTQNYFAQ